ncbi:MAG TPA: aconitate hydratase, partial [Trebonia sp.]|nr:aconitate hydratase [Trebonia sp.]
MSIYDASRRYIEEGTPLIVLGGKEYGSGSSRDWAAKGTALLGVRAVLTESFERIHRSNLIGMGVLPLQFKPGESAATLGLSGQEVFSIAGISEINNKEIIPNELVVTADDKQFTVVVRIDTPGEAEYYRHGGIMPYVLRSLRAAHQVSN